MPKVVDHDARREELVDAVWAVIIDEGLEGVSIRRVAQRSGWSSGALRHYLPTREDMLDAAAGRVAEVLEERIQAVESEPDPMAALIGVLGAVLPTDASTRRASQVWLAFVGRAVSETSASDAQGILYRDLNQLLVHLLGWLAETGRPISGGPEPAAAYLHALVDGLTAHVLLGQVTAEQARALLEVAVHMLVGAPGSSAA